jgi:carbonic anhydrase
VAEIAPVQRLHAGIHHFQANYFASNRALFEQLAEAGQRPETLFITCSDSRVVPELITNAAPGELFIVRNVGNIVPDTHHGVVGGVSAAIEYAVEMLQVQTVIVCGHMGCGALDAMLHPESVAHLPLVKRWLAEASHLPLLVEERYGHLDREARMKAAVQENVLLQLENLRSFDFVARRLDAGTLTMNGWVFDIFSGRVFDYDPVQEQFLALAREGAGGERRQALSEPPPSVRGG